MSHVCVCVEVFAGRDEVVVVTMGGAAVANCVSLAAFLKWRSASA